MSGAQSWTSPSSTRIGVAAQAFVTASARWTKIAQVRSRKTRTAGAQRGERNLPRAGEVANARGSGVGCLAVALWMGACAPAESGDGARAAGAAGAGGGAATSGAGGAAGSATCVAECELDATRCNGNVIEMCAAGPGGCATWSAGSDCAQAGAWCDASSGTAECTEKCADQCTLGTAQCSAHVIQTCGQLGDCTAWQSSTDCSASGQTCSGAGGAPACVAMATGEHCGSPIPIKGGMNTVSWTATVNDDLLVNPSCLGTGFPVTGPDVVLSYTSPITGSIDVTLVKPKHQRALIVGESGACGTFANQVLCNADFSLAVAGGRFDVTQGTTYYFHVADATQPNGAPLPQPLSINVAEIDCSTFVASAIHFAPAKAATLSTLSPALTVSFDTPVVPNVGTVMLSGDKGTNLSIPLPSPSVMFMSANKTMKIMPEIKLQPDEVVSVTWTGLNDAACNKPVSAAGWSFKTPTPPCTPGQNGMLGTSVSKLVTPLTTGFTDSYFYVAADENPNGYVYVGNPTALARFSKSVAAPIVWVSGQAALSSAHLGYAMLIDGDDVFTFNSTSNDSAGLVWRISNDAGASWMKQDYVGFSTTPGDSIEGVTFHDGALYMVTSESSTSVPTEIWSAAKGAAPNPATKIASFTGEASCNGIAVDDTYQYLACAMDHRLLRRDRTTGAITLLADDYFLGTVTTQVIADDVDADGAADYLYFKGPTAAVHVVCAPQAPTPFYDVLVAYGDLHVGNHGLSLDTVNDRLYTWEHETHAIVMID